MFLIGLLGSVLVKNMIKVLISIEIMLLGVNINFVTFASFCDNVKFDGYIMALFYVALYLFYLMFQKKGSDNIESYKEL